MTTLLSRDEFREGVFARDSHRCVICGEPAADAHHIIERRLFPDGGYYLDNGSSLCNDCHLQAEMTTLDCETIREACGIKTVILPPHLYRDTRYDKWGNPYGPDGLRAPGELFYDPNVQKILREGKVLDQFSSRVKYPRTYHLPWSPGATKDDRIADDLSKVQSSEVVVTEKMDGENTTLYTDYLHARSVSYSPHPSRNWMKAIHAQVCGDIPYGWRVCGENVYAKHSIGYDKLPGYFMVFSIWDEHNCCLDWDETVEWAGLLGLPIVPVLYRGPWDEAAIRAVYNEPREEDREGYVVRTAEGFALKDFRRHLLKYVRQNHVSTSNHWRFERVTPNTLEQ